MLVQKKVFVFGQNQTNLDALTLALEICDYQVASTRHSNNVPQMVQSLQSDLVLFDVSKSDKELTDLLVHLKEQLPQSSQLVGYLANETKIPQENISRNLDHFIPQPAINIEEFSERVKQFLTK